MNMPFRMLFLSIGICCSTLLLGCSATSTSSAAPTAEITQIPQNQTLHALFDEIWDYETGAEASTQSALPNIAPEYLAQRHRRFSAYLAQLASFDPTRLNKQDQISLTMQVYRLQNYVEQYRYQEYLMPITSEYGFHSSLLNLPYRFDFSKTDEVERYIATLAEVPAYFAQQITYMREGMRVGKVQPQVVMQGFEASVASVIKDDPRDSRFYSPALTLSTTLSDVSPAQITQYQTAVARAITEHINAAYQTFYDFLVAEYIPNAKTDIAAKTWPDGEAFYNNRIKHYTTLELSAQAIHEIGLKEVARIRAEMQGVLDTLDYTGSINDFIAFLRTDPQFYATTPQELVDYAMVLSKRIDALLPKLFNKLPRTPYGVAPVPDDIAPKYTTGRYISPRNDQEPGYYWVNTYALDKRPLYALPALTLHEAVPGHHLQISLAREMQDLPKVRQRTYISAFGEGWGLYSEFLGKEIGFYQTPYDEFGALSYEMWRACRLVVDTGMHMFGWTREQAVAYMLENTALSEHNVNTEIDRYISWPGQALAYKLGEIRIRELRAEAEATLGTDFDLRAFHAAILEYGSVPISVLEANLKTYINNVLANRGPQ